MHSKTPEAHLNALVQRKLHRRKLLHLLRRVLNCTRAPGPGPLPHFPRGEVPRRFEVAQVGLGRGLGATHVHLAPVAHREDDVLHLEKHGERVKNTRLDTIECQ